MTRCPWCIGGHAKVVMKAGAAKEEIAEGIQVTNNILELKAVLKKYSLSNR